MLVAMKRASITTNMVEDVALYKHVASEYSDKLKHHFPFSYVLICKVSGREEIMQVAQTDEHKEQRRE